MPKKPKAQLRFKCSKCESRFKRRSERTSHLSTEHNIHVSYASLIEPWNHWGQTFAARQDADEFRKSPSNDALHLGYLALILTELRELKRELKRERTIR